VLPGNFHGGTPLGIEGDFLVGPEQLNIIDQYMNQSNDGRTKHQFTRHPNSFTNAHFTNANNIHSINSAGIKPRLAGHEMQDNNLILSRGNAARQLLKKAHTSSLET